MIDHEAREAAMIEKAKNMDEVMAWADGPSPSCTCPDWADAAIRSMAAEIRRLRGDSK